MTLREFYNNLRNLEIDLIKEEAILMHKDEIVKLNQDQLRLGRTIKDRNIQPKYTSKYLKRKQRMSTYLADSGQPDLYVSGEFYGEMDLIVEGGKWFITSFDRKVGWLAEWYKDIFGLTSDAKEKSQKIVTPTFLQLIRKKLNN